MSVWQIEQVYDPPLGERSAWKTFDYYSGELRTPHFTLDGEVGKQSLPKEVWLRATVRTARTIRGEEYDSGFHAFELESDANLWRLGATPVRLRGIRLLGLHAPEGRRKEVPTLRCWIADEMMIL